MKEIVPGHLYELENLKHGGVTSLQFYQDGNLHGTEVRGPSTQEVLRACIARVQHLDSELPWEGNEAIIHHLRAAIAGFEARAIYRHAEKGYAVETLPTHSSGHVFPTP